MQPASHNNPKGQCRLFIVKLRKKIAREAINTGLRCGIRQIYCNCKSEIMKEIITKIQGDLVILHKAVNIAIHLLTILFANLK